MYTLEHCTGQGREVQSSKARTQQALDQGRSDQVQNLQKPKTPGAQILEIKPVQCSSTDGSPQSGTKVQCCTEQC